MEKLSTVGNNIVGSEIIKISQQIKEISKTKTVINLTIGDFNSKVWPIPSSLRQHIKYAYDDDLTNYPNSQGELSLRESVSKHIKTQFNVDYSPEEILIGGGVRPLIYTVYKATVNPNEEVIYPVPSWNNNHYCFLHNAKKEQIEVRQTNDSLRSEIFILGTQLGRYEVTLEHFRNDDPEVYQKFDEWLSNNTE